MRSSSVINGTYKCKNVARCEKAEAEGDLAGGRRGKTRDGERGEQSDDKSECLFGPEIFSQESQ